MSNSNSCPSMLAMTSSPAPLPASSDWFVLIVSSENARLRAHPAQNSSAARLLSANAKKARPTTSRTQRGEHSKRDEARRNAEQQRARHTAQAANAPVRAEMKRRAMLA